MLEPIETQQPAFDQSGYSTALCNFIALVAPTISDDETQSYAPNSVWYKTSATVGLWKCTDATEGAAVWKQIALTGLTGTVTNFSAGDFSPLFTTSEATTTTTPALTFAAITQTANTAFRGPASGGAAAPTFRAPVALDFGTGSASNLNFLRGDLTFNKYLGSNAPLSSALFGIVAPGNNLEFGHSTTGYRGTLGAESTFGHVFLALHAEAGTNNNTYRTRGVKGMVIRSDLLGGIQFVHIPLASADNQAGTLTFTFRNDGQLNLGSNVSNLKFGANALAQSDSMTLGTSPGGSGFASIDGNYGLYTGMSGSGHAWMQVGRVDGSATAYDLALQFAGGKVLIGANSGNGKLSVFATTQQFEMGYSATQKWSATTDSAGVTTFDGVGTTPKFIFSDDVDVTGYIRSSKFKDYMVMISQTGTSAPTVDVIDNSLGAVVWTRNSAGSYTGTLTGAFSTAAKCFFTPKWSYYPEDDILIKITYGNADGILLESEQALSGTDGLLSAFPILIRVLQ